MASFGCVGKDYLDEFDPSKFLNDYGTIDRRRQMLRWLHDALSDLPGDITVLDYGSGPSICGIISAAAKASSIILSDYSAANHQTVRDWLDNKPGAFDWDPHFSFIVKELEGGSDVEVVRRKQNVRHLVMGIAHCDLTQKPPIEEQFNKLYDVVVSTYVLESVARNDEEYFSMMSRIANLVLPGGSLFICGVENQSW